MRISAVLEKVKTLSKEELVSMIKICEQALIESKAAAAQMSASHRLLYAKPRFRTLEQAIIVLKGELQSRK